MHILLAIGITILTATQAQAPPSLAPTEPLKAMTFVNAEFRDAISLVAKSGGIVIEMDQTVSDSMQRQKIGTMRMRDVTVEQAVAQLTRVVGLSYTVVDGKTVRIFKKA